MLENQLSRYGAIAQAVPFTAGKIFFVVNSVDSWFGDFQKTFPNDRDGVPRTYSDIQAALDACVDGRGDTVLVVPSATDYTPAVGITMTKAHVRLLCLEGLGATIGASPRGATINQSTAAGHTITISGRGCEVGGFWIRGGTEKYAITLTAAATGAWIHNNDIAIYSTSSSGTLAGGIIDAAGVAGLVVEKNHVFSNSGTSATIVAGISCIAGSTRAVIRMNIVSVSNGCTMTSGIQNLAVMGVTSDNIVAAHQASGSGEATGVLTKGIRLGLCSAAVRNTVVISTAADAFTGGTTSKGGVLNYDSASGGTLIDVT